MRKKNNRNSTFVTGFSNRHSAGSDGVAYLDLSALRGFTAQKLGDTTNAVRSITADTTDLPELKNAGMDDGYNIREVTISAI